LLFRNAPSKPTGARDRLRRSNTIAVEVDCSASGSQACRVRRQDAGGAHACGPSFRKLHGSKSECFPAEGDFDSAREDKLFETHLHVLRSRGPGTCFDPIPVLPGSAKAKPLLLSKKTGPTCPGSASLAAEPTIDARELGAILRRLRAASISKNSSPDILLLNPGKTQPRYGLHHVIGWNSGRLPCRREVRSSR